MMKTLFLLAFIKTLVLYSTIYACSIGPVPTYSFNEDYFIYSAKVVDIITKRDISVISDGEFDSWFGGLILEPIREWNMPETLQLHAVFQLNLLADCSYSYESFETMSNHYMPGDTIAVVAQKMNPGLWGTSDAIYPQLVIPILDGSLANTKYLKPEFSIDNTVNSFSTYIDSLNLKLQEIINAEQLIAREIHGRLRGKTREERERITKSERENMRISSEMYEATYNRLGNSFIAVRMRQNFEFQRNLALLHKSESEQEKFYYLSTLSHNWYSGTWFDRMNYRKKFDCAFTLLAQNYLSDEQYSDRIFEVFKSNNDRTLPAHADCSID